MSTRITAAAVLSLIVAAPFAAASPAHARHPAKPTPRVTVLTGKILAGNPHNFVGVGKIDRKAVFEAIPAIRTIRKEGLSRDSARYRFLLVEANKVFQHALERVARENKVDLVAESGGVTAVGIGVVDLTPAVKKLVSR